MSRTEASETGRRGRGRAARMAERAAPLADQIKPVRGGLEGGW